ncbi:MAG: GTA-gp10 family protein [Pseudomonadota bacterium]
MIPPNPHRGDVVLIIDGTARPMRLTLGALASLEARLQSESLSALVARFEGGAVRAEDLLALLSAGLGGAGQDIDESTLAKAEIEGGAVAALEAALALLAAAFRPSP